MKSYLSNRKRVVGLNDKRGQKGLVTCGVTQGSILGPLPLLFFINDLSLFLTNTVYSTDLYVDDTTIYNKQNESNLQSSLYSLREWCIQNGMLLNAEKTKAMLITTRQKKKRKKKKKKKKKGYI